ncbi:MAG: DUF4259 domain-containing protein [Pseudomonadota bacterium]
MGAWGLKSFDNDDAMDWVAEFEEAGAEAIKTTLDAALNDIDELEAPEACEALAAAEIVAATKTGDQSNLSEHALTALAKYAGEVATPENLVLAKGAIGRIKSNSELRDLWQDTDEFDAWIKDVEALEARLA